MPGGITTNMTSSISQATWHQEPEETEREYNHRLQGGLLACYQLWEGEVDDDGMPKIRIPDDLLEALERFTGITPDA
jgi:hypothetical protein